MPRSDCPKQQSSSKMQAKLSSSKKCAMQRHKISTVKFHRRPSQIWTIFVPPFRRETCGLKLWDSKLPELSSIKVRRHPNMDFTTNLARGHYLSSMKTMMLLRICFWPKLYTFDSSRSSIFPFKTVLMSKIWLQCTCFRELVISTHHHEKQ